MPRITRITSTPKAPRIPKISRIPSTLITPSPPSHPSPPSAPSPFPLSVSGCRSGSGAAGLLLFLLNHVERQLLHATSV